MALGALGVLVFSFSFPATKLALRGLDPWTVGFGRAAIASVLAALALRDATRPTRAQARRLAVVAGGVVIGFPLLTNLALATSGSAHGAVVIAILPAATAAFAVLRGGERPGPAFWAAAGTGVLVVGGYAIGSANGGFTGADLLELVAVVTCALGYAEGGVLSRELGGARTICWALVLSAPLTVPGTIASVALDHDTRVSAAAAIGFAYVSVGSMFLGFFAWYGGLARGGIARIGQIQLTQPLMTVGWSALVLNERVTPTTLVAAAAVLGCVGVAQRARVATSAARSSEAPADSPLTPEWSQRDPLSRHNGATDASVRFPASDVG